MRFLKPTKLGIASASWLRHDVWATEWTAATCLYFLLMRTRRRASGVFSTSSTVVSIVEPLGLISVFDMTDLLVRTAFRSVLVTVEVSTAVAIVAIRRSLRASRLCDGTVSEKEQLLFIFEKLLFYYYFVFMSLLSYFILSLTEEREDNKVKRRGKARMLGLL